MTSSSDLAQDIAQRLTISNSDKCSLESMTRKEGLAWLKQFNVRILDPKALSDEDIEEKLRFALWDSQRIDYLFHGAAHNDGKQLDVANFSSWPKWKEPRLELKNRRIGMRQMDGYKDAKKLDGYIFRHFNTSVFSQIEMIQGINADPPEGLSGAWIGAKNMMGSAALDLTGDGGKDCPFSAFITLKGRSLLIEYIDVKQCPWPEPSDKVMRTIRSVQESKFGQPKDAPLVPMLQTPKFPLLVVRYAYFERKPTNGSNFVSYLEQQIKKKTKGATAQQIRKKLEFHLGAAITVSDEHMKMFVRVLSYNSKMLSSDYTKDLQSHWNVSQEVANETDISFFVPCLRLRHRPLEEIETGVRITVPRVCRACGNPAVRMCASCQSVYYCNLDCSKSDWPTHKTICKFSKRLLDPNVDFASDKFYAPTRNFHSTIMENHFAVEQEAIKVSGVPPEGDCPPNEYGDEPFVIRIYFPPDYSINGSFKGQTAMLWDRRRSLQLRSGPGDSPFAVSQGEAPIPFHAKGHASLMRLVKTRGIQRQLIYLWARRTGDCLEIDLAKPVVPDNLW